MTSTPKSFFTRIKKYSDEMFPVLIYLPYIIALYVCMNFTSQAISSGEIVIDIYGVVGMISAFFVMLMMRTFDDLKDFDLDKELFPWRETAKGNVLKLDIQKVSWFSFLTLVVVNVFFAMDTIIVFAVVITYCILTFQWFFAEKIHRENIFLTMATHQPIPYAINFFLLHTALASGGFYHDFDVNQFYLLLVFSLPVTAWEVSRKIRSADKETEYETFSMIFGAKGAAIIAFIPLLLAGALCLYLGSQLNLHGSFVWVVIAMLVFISFFYLRFIFNPTDKNNVLLNMTMGYTSVLFFGFLGYTMAAYEVSLNL